MRFISLRSCSCFLLSTDRLDKEAYEDIDEGLKPELREDLDDPRILEGSASFRIESEVELYF